VVSGGELSQFQMINDDCLKVLPTLKDKSIDLVLTDPPYGTTQCKWDSVIPFSLMWLNLKRIIKDNGCVALFGTEPFSSHLRLSNLDWFKYDWVWNKKRISNPLLAKKQPLRNIELISVFYNKQPIYNPQPTQKSTGKGLSQKNHNLFHSAETIGKSKYRENRLLPEVGYPKVLLEHIKVMNNLSKDKSGLHPTQKPIELCEYLIKTYTNENDTVLDFTMGSGSTGVACKNLSRDFIGIELDKDYYKIAKQRVGVLN
jgi:DNA modification methylase